MKKLATLIILCAGAGSAFADIPPGPPPQRPPAPATPPAAPKPDAALAALKPWVGAWKCAGKYTMAGVDTAFSGTMKSAFDFDGFWLVEHGDSKVHHSVSYLGYKASDKLYTMSYFDSGGDTAQETSPGPDANGKWVWTGKGTDVGQPVDVTDNYEVAKDGKSMHIFGSDSGGSYDATCKK